MIRDALVIFRKEIRNILKDRRTLMATLLVPLLLIPAIFVGMDFVQGQQMEAAEEEIYSIVIRNNRDPLFQELVAGRLLVSFDEQPGENTLIVEFPAGYEPGEPAEVRVLYDSTSQKSSYAASMISGALSEYSAGLASNYLAEFGISLESLYTISVQRVDTAPEQAQGAGFLLVMVPYLILIYVFAGAMSVGMDTTAGEKERGSLAVVLVNQISRTSIALGKVLYVVVMGITSSIMTFIGFIAAMQMTGGIFGEAASIASFSLVSLLILLITLVVTSMLAASIIVYIGSLARTMKEASSYILPIYFIVIIMGVVTMNIDPSANPLLFLVPFLNTVFLLKGAIIGSAVLMQMLLLFLSDGLVIALLIYSTSRLYNSEKILNTIA